MFMPRIGHSGDRDGPGAAPAGAEARRGFGLHLVAMALMPPYLAAVAIWFVAAAGAKIIVAAAITAWRTIVHAGELVVGR